MACQTTRNDNFLKWNEDLFWLVTQEAIKLRKLGFIVLALGDFNSRVGLLPGLEGNTPDTNLNAPMFLNFICEVNMVIINTLPISRGLFTRFMDSSNLPGTRSLLDYGAIDSDHVDTVTTFLIDEDARHACGSDHALLECDLEFSSRPNIKWSFHDALQYNINESTDFTQYKTTLDHSASSIKLSEFSSLSAEQMLPHISETLNHSAMKSFGLKVKKKNRTRRLPKDVIELIKTKNSFYKRYRNALMNSSSEVAETALKELKEMKVLVKEKISEVNIKRRNHLRSKTLKADPSRKRFWRFLKSQIKSAGSISAIYDKEGQMVFDQTEIEEAILHHFSNVFQGKRHPCPEAVHTPSQLEAALAEYDQALGQHQPVFHATKFQEEVCPPYTFIELEEILKKLPSGKASGYDKISNEMLKNCSFTFKQYLILFLNHIIEEGTIPPDLNTGKCMLIFKVG